MYDRPKILEAQDTATVRQIERARLDWFAHVVDRLVHELRIQAFIGGVEFDEDDIEISVRMRAWGRQQ